MADQNKTEAKKGFFARMFESLDKKMKEKAAASGCCCCSSETKDGEKKGCC